MVSPTPVLPSPSSTTVNVFVASIVGFADV